MDEDTDALSAFATAVHLLAEDAAAAVDRRTALGLVARSAALRSELDGVLAVLVTRARQTGATWQNVGDVLGISRQAAFQRFGRPIDPRTGELMNTIPVSGAAELATTVFDDMAGGKWQTVVERFDERMKEGLSADELAAAWAQTIGTVGAFEGADGPTARRTADVTVVDVPLRFEAADMTGRLALRDDLSIAGLFILSPDALEPTGDAR
jgi:hypothetical protein